MLKHCAKKYSFLTSCSYYKICLLQKNQWEKHTEKKKITHYTFTVTFTPCHSSLSMHIYIPETTVLYFAFSLQVL